MKFLCTSQAHFDTKWLTEDHLFFPPTPPHPTNEYNPTVGNEVWTGWSGLWGWDGDTEGSKEKVILVNTPGRGYRERERSRYQASRKKYYLCPKIKNAIFLRLFIITFAEDPGSKKWQKLL